MLKRTQNCILLLLVLASLNGHVEAKPTAHTEQKIHAILKAFNVPGAAIGVIHNGKVVMKKGFGTVNIRTGKPVTTDSMFKIASNTKAFTAASLALLVDQGKLNWQDKVVKHLPNFKLYDPWVTAQFNVIDLLTHRSGLGLGAGDLMLWPEPSSFSRAEIIHNLRYLPQSGEFRADYAYDNLLYIVAGELVASISGQSWENFVEQQIMQPLSMLNCSAGHPKTIHQALLATPHAMVGNQLQALSITNASDKPHVSAAAGGIRCSLNDMLKWIKVQLNTGKMPNGKVLFSVEQQQQMWQPHTILPLSNAAKKRDKTYFSAYGLGWRLHDVDGYRRVHHTGSLAGMYSAVTLFPELDLGIVVLTNQQSSAARNALIYTLMKPYLGDTQTNWLKVFSPRKSNAQHKTQQDDGAGDLLKPQSVVAKQLLGRYRDPWLGDFVIELKDNRLNIRSERMVRLVGDLYQHSKANQYVVRWHDRSLEADVYAIFSYHNHQVTGMKLLPVFKDIDFSYDFQDLAFRRIK